MAERPLIGLSPDQVSTNGMLGDLAFQDSDSAYIETIRGKVSLDKLDKSIEDTAVDIFVYDTRKDSDGGAWRKRTTHTSWYNETLNTTTRGSRREFPSVAVIVATTSKVTIYDGDDPDLPMWMVFEANNNGSTGTYMLQYNTTGGSSVTALNGIIVSGHNSNGATTINFINESATRYRVTSASGTYHIYQSIVNRNIFTIVSTYDSTIGLVNSAVNDVAMTVLPNAPIDDATGLPIPTIAVATDGGVSVIKDDGTVVDLTYLEGGNTIVKMIDIDSNGRIYWSTRETASAPGIYFHEVDLPSSDSNAEPPVNLSTNQAGAANAVKPTIISGNLIDVVRAKDRTVLSLNGSDSKGHLNLYNVTGNVNSSGSVDNFEMADISTNYNTGWMHGDIKGAFLSDTDATNVSAVVVNSSTSDWSQQGTHNWTITSATEITVSSVASGQSAILRLTTDSSKHYVYSFNVTSISDNLTFRDDQNDEIEDPYPSSTGVYTGSFTGTSYVDFTVYQTDSATITDIDIREAEEDRSVNQNGLGIYGTVTKSAVATGAELVAYSGWSDSNYLEQPYNSDLDFGTGDFSVMGWFKPNTLGTYDTFISRGSAGGISFECSVNSSKYIRMSLNTSSVQSTTIPSDGVWSFYTAVRRSGVIYLYHNGVFLTSGAQTDSVTDTDAIMKFGNRHDVSGINDFDGSLALWRVSGSAPSAEQVKKMYEDEKVLFQENAKCTLYGSSDAVTALAYDDSTNILYAGTSSGRSDFQGLRRINNTTTAVTTAISASNGLVAEQ